MRKIFASVCAGSIRLARLALAAFLLSSTLFGEMPTPSAQASTQFDIHGPTGSGTFGQAVVVLPNGNFVVTDPGYDAPGPIADVGAVYLYNGATSALISTLTGSTAGDQVGSGGVTVLSNSNYVVVSPDWDNGPAVDAGAVTLRNGAACPVVFSIIAINAANSVRGTTAGGGSNLNFSYNTNNDQLIVGGPADNIVSLFRGSGCTYQYFAPWVAK